MTEAVQEWREVLEKLVNLVLGTERPASFPAFILYEDGVEFSGDESIAPIMLYFDAIDDEELALRILHRCVFECALVRVIFDAIEANVFPKLEKPQG